MSRPAATAPIVIADYDPEWSARYETERERIVGAIGEWLAGIEHVGSTAVPDLAAKPIIDIMPGLRTLDDAPHVIAAMQDLGYQYIPDYEDELPERRYFARPAGDENRGRRLFHVHAVETTSAFWRRHIAFRDYLRSHHEARDKYAALKRHLAAAHGADRVAYTDAKTEFISGIERLALGEGA